MFHQIFLVFGEMKWKTLKVYPWNQIGAKYCEFTVKVKNENNTCFVDNNINGVRDQHWYNKSTTILITWCSLCHMNIMACRITNNSNVCWTARSGWQQGQRKVSKMLHKIQIFVSSSSQRYKTSMLISIIRNRRTTGHLWVERGFPSQRASSAESVFMTWYRHVTGTNYITS